jgi:hypothetical protein
MIPLYLCTLIYLWLSANQFNEICQVNYFEGCVDDKKYEFLHNFTNPCQIAYFITDTLRKVFFELMLLTLSFEWIMMLRIVRFEKKLRIEEITFE